MRVPRRNSAKTGSGTRVLSHTCRNLGHVSATTVDPEQTGSHEARADGGPAGQPSDWQKRERHEIAGEWHSLVYQADHRALADRLVRFRAEIPAGNLRIESDRLGDSGEVSWRTREMHEQLAPNLPRPPADET